MAESMRGHQLCGYWVPSVWTWLAGRMGSARPCGAERFRPQHGGNAACLPTQAREWRSWVAYEPSTTSTAFCCRLNPFTRGRFAGDYFGGFFAWFDSHKTANPPRRIVCQGLNVPKKLRWVGYVEPQCVHQVGWLVGWLVGAFTTLHHMHTFACNCIQKCTHTHTHTHTHIYTHTHT